MRIINLILQERAALLLFSFCAIFYSSAPVIQKSDSNYSMMVSQSLIDYGTIRLDGYNIERSKSFSKPGILKSGYPYQIEVSGEKLFYYFHHGFLPML